MRNTYVENSADCEVIQSVPTEEQIISGILFDPGALDIVSEVLSPGDFFSVSHAEVFRTCLALASKSVPVDLISVSSEMAARGSLEQCGGRAFLARLAESTISAVNIQSHAEIVKEKSLRREMLRSGQKIVELGQQQARPFADCMDEAEQLIFDMGSPTEERLGLEHVQDVSVRALMRIEEGAAVGYKMGLPELDALTQGFVPGTLNIVAARTSMGKTHFAIAAAWAIASLHDLPVVFYSCEMTKEQVFVRLASHVTKIDSAILARGGLSEQERAVLDSAISRINGKQLYIKSAASPTAGQIRGDLRRIANRGERIGLIILDYIQLLGAGSDNRVGELDKIVRDCRSIAMDFSAPFLALAQINRGVENRGEKRPVLSDIRESGAIEQHADTVLMLYRDEYYDSQSTDKGIMEVAVAKNRNGKTGKCRLLFEPSTSVLRTIPPRGSNGTY